MEDFKGSLDRGECTPLVGKHSRRLWSWQEHMVSCSLLPLICAVTCVVGGFGGFWLGRVQSNSNPVKKVPSITDIFYETGTDKWIPHGYNRYYETELAPYRDLPGVRILEIGAESGRSLQAWALYFTNPGAIQSVAYKVNPEDAKKKTCEVLGDKCDLVTIYSLDQSDVEALHNMQSKEPSGWDIIIDDASHFPAHQMISFQHLWPSIRPGGLYVIEDIESSYVDDGEKIYWYPLWGGIGKPPPSSSPTSQGNVVEKFKQLIDVVNRRHFGHDQFSVFHGVDADVASVRFGDGLIFVQKKPATPMWDQKFPKTMFGDPKHSDKSFKEWQSKLGEH